MFCIPLIKNWNWRNIFNRDLEQQQHVLKFGPLSIMNDRCKMMVRLILISSPEIRLSKPKIGKTGTKKQKPKKQTNSKQHFDVMQIFLAAQRAKVGDALCPRAWFLRWLLGLGLLQRRSLHGDHYSRFHMLNKRNCRKKSLKFKSGMCHLTKKEQQLTHQCNRQSHPNHPAARLHSWYFPWTEGPCKLQFGKKTDTQCFTNF